MSWAHHSLMASRNIVAFPLVVPIIWLWTGIASGQSSREFAEDRPWNYQVPFSDRGLIARVLTLAMSDRICLAWLKFS